MGDLTVSLKMWLRGMDSNHRPPGYEPDELPLLYPTINSVAESEGFEPPGRSSRPRIFKIRTINQTLTTLLI